MSKEDETHYEVVRIKKHSMYEMLKIGVFLCVVCVAGNIFTGGNASLNAFITDALGVGKSIIAVCQSCLAAI